jgi:hypothetical protein
VRYALTLCLAAFLAGCGSPQQVAGTASQTGNSVASGRILLVGDTTGAAGVVVSLRPLSWVHGDSAAAGALQTDTTDALGNYRFDGVPADTYRVEASGTGVGWSKTFRATGGTTTLATGTLSKWGRLRLHIEAHDSMAGRTVGFYGLDRQTTVPSSSTGDMSLLIDSLPVGLQSVIVYDTRSEIVAGASVEIYADSTVVLRVDSMDTTFHQPSEDD